MKYTSAKLRKMKRVRAKLGRGTSVRPRISVYRSNRYVYAQAIDDEKRVTLASVSSDEKSKETGTKRSSTTAQKAREMGKTLGALLMKKGIKMSLFDRGSYLYHGKVKALAEGLREAGIQV